MNEEAQNLEAVETDDGFLEGWNDSDGVTAPDADRQSEDAQEEVQQQAVSPAAEKAPEERSAPAAEGDAQEAQTQDVPAARPAAPDKWVIKHMGVEETIGVEDITPELLQKGRDYERIREKYDEAKPVMEMFSSFAKQAGMSVSDYVSHIRMQARMSRGESEADARRTISLEDREAAVAAKEAAQQQAEQAAQEAANSEEQARERRNADLQRFRQVFPDAAKDANGIPAAVWEQVNGGLTLVEAYSQYAVAQAKAAQAAAEQRAAAADLGRRNDARATGSMRSAGDSAQGKDPFLEGWGD